MEREMKELKETGGSRVRKVDVEELRRKAARLGKLCSFFLRMSYNRHFLTLQSFST